MIVRIIVRNFKSLRAIDLSLDRTNLFIGANSSGKSNFLEAFRILQGIGRGLSISKIFDGHLGDETFDIWQGIRGGSTKACSIWPLTGNQEVTIQAQGTLPSPVSDMWDFAITFTPSNGHVVRESLRVGSETLYLIEKPAVPNTAQGGDRIGRPYLTQQCTKFRQMARDSGNEIANHSQVISAVEENAYGHVIDQIDRQEYSKFRIATLVARSLASVQQLDPLPHILREQCLPNQEVPRMGDHGKGFLALVHAICRDEAASDQYFSWMREFLSKGGGDLTSALSALSEVSSLSPGVDSRVELAALSDGTLRFAALVAAFFQPDMPEIMLIDEIETSIHAGQVRLLVELLGTHAGCQATQVIATTHSPVVLEWLKGTNWANIFFCNLDHDSGESMIRPLQEVPRSEDLLKDQHFFDVLTGRWLELIS